MTIRPASTTDSSPPLASAHRLKLLPVLIGLYCATQACATVPWQARRSAGPTGLFSQDTDRQEPALSGDGQWLATLLLRDGRPTLLLQKQPSGVRVPLPNLRGLTPHRSPSLSWNGRYVALVVQQGPRRQAVVEDRASGRLHRIQLPIGLEPERLSLAPDGRRLAVATVVQGRPQVQLFDLSGVLEPDLPPAQSLRGPSTPMESP